MKKLKKYLATLAVLVAVFCLSGSVLAAENDPVYAQSLGTSIGIDVYITIESEDIPFTVIPITLPPKVNGVQTVLDAMLEPEVSEAGYVFCTSSAENNVTTFTPITAESSYFSHIKYGDNYFCGQDEGYSGWVFRINGGFPLDSSEWNATIASVVIQNGDIISFYVDDPFSEGSATRFTRISMDSVACNSVTAFVTESHQYYGTDWAWTVTNYAPIGNLNVYLYDDISLTSPIAVTTANSMGYVVFSDLLLEPGIIYYVKVSGNMSATPPISSCFNIFTIQ